MVSCFRGESELEGRTEDELDSDGRVLKGEIHECVASKLSLIHLNSFMRTGVVRFAVLQ
jgi:hypothetical protein